MYPQNTFKTLKFPTTPLLAQIPHPEKSNQGIWQDVERNRKLHGNSRAYYAEDLVNYAVKIANYAVVLEQMTRKNWSIMQKKIASYADFSITIKFFLKECSQHVL